MISFRLSAEEYNACREACSRVGLRSISELARVGLQQLFAGRGGAVADNRIDDLRGRIQFLSTELDRIADEIRQQDATRMISNGYNQQEQL